MYKNEMPIFSQHNTSFWQIEDDDIRQIDPDTESHLVGSVYFHKAVAEKIHLIDHREYLDRRKSVQSPAIAMPTATAVMLLEITAI